MNRRLRDIMDNMATLKKNLFCSMPQGTLSLFAIQIFSTLSFSVLYSTLVLYMVKKLGVSITNANSIMGVFLAFNYGLHLLGGLWGGKLLSNRSLFSIGMIFQVVGCIILSLSQYNLLYLGLAFFLTGSGLNVTCVNCMLTQRFSAEDTRRENAFLMNYAGMNIGFFIGFTLSGVFQLSQNYGQLFLLSSIGNFIALMICFYHWRQLGDINTDYANKTKESQRKSVILGTTLIFLIPFILNPILVYADFAKKLILIVGVMIFFYLFYISKQQQSEETKNKIFAFAVLLLFSTVFWMLYQIAPMGLTAFIDHNVQRNFSNWTIAPQWFQNINTITIVIGGPVMAIILNQLRNKGWQVNIPTQFTLALLFIGVAFVILPIGIYNADEQGFVSPEWIILCYILQSIGELLISPIGYAMIGYLAPPSMQGMMMGMWMLAAGFGGTLSSYSSNLMVSDQNILSPLITNANYSQVFLSLGLFAVSIGIILGFFIPWLRKMMQEKIVVSITPNTTQISKREILCE